MTSPQIDIAINSFRRGGGMESYTFDLVRGLTGRGADIHIFAARLDNSLPEYARITPHLIAQGWIPKKLRPYYFSKSLQAARAGRNAPLLACNPSDHADIFICGGTHLGYLANMGKRANPIDKLTIRRNRSNYASAKSIMAHSHLMQRELTGYYGVPSEKIRVIHPPADTERFRPQPEHTAALRRKYGFADSDTVFLFPSTGHKRKGLDLLADFFEHTDLPVKLAVAGSPLPRPMKNVIELGFCPDMPELYRAADYTVMASLYEPFGLVGIESVLCGTKVVLSDNMACTEVMNSEAGFFFSRARPDSFAEAVRAAILLKQGGVSHKIADPLAALTYNPTLPHHIDRLQAMLAAV
ncbi:glycosyltransferase family 4 protein [Bergeriella denitrificans]|nr:glycosyltransferase family 4 protein [Bergeriella denitrificans]